jgi:inosine-uridine nucleoside N-ribohydrolase
MGATAWATPERRRDSYEPDERSAARFIVEQAHAHPGQVTLLAVGPLTNLSQALRLEPKLPELLKQVIVVGGSIAAPGNVSPVAESNIWHDPHAADQIFTAGFRLTLVGLDVTHARPCCWRCSNALLGTPALATDTLLNGSASSRLSRRWSRNSRGQACRPDVLALMFLLRPELFQVETGRVRVATEGLAEGQTIMDRREHIPYPQPGWENISGAPGRPGADGRPVGAV